MVEDLGVQPGLTVGLPPGAVRGVDAADLVILMVLKAEVVGQAYLRLKVRDMAISFGGKRLGKQGGETIKITNLV